MQRDVNVESNAAERESRVEQESFVTTMFDALLTCFDEKSSEYLIISNFKSAITLNAQANQAMLDSRSDHGLFLKPKAMREKFATDVLPKREESDKHLKEAENHKNDNDTCALILKICKIIQAMNEPKVDPTKYISYLQSLNQLCDDANIKPTLAKGNIQKLIFEQFQLYNIEPNNNSKSKLRFWKKLSDKVSRSQSSRKSKRLNSENHKKSDEIFQL